MILKIRNQGAWWLYDDLARVHFARSGEGRVRRNMNSGDWEVRKNQQVGHGADKQEYTEFTPDAVFFDPEKEGKATAETMTPREKSVNTEWEFPAWVCYRDRDDNERFIVFDEAFLLNDAGQTIERIR